MSELSERPNNRKSTSSTEKFQSTDEHMQKTQSIRIKSKTQLTKRQHQLKLSPNYPKFSKFSKIPTKYHNNTYKQYRTPQKSRSKTAKEVLENTSELEELARKTAISRENEILRNQLLSSLKKSRSESRKIRNLRNLGRQGSARDSVKVKKRWVKGNRLRNTGSLKMLKMREWNKQIQLSQTSSHVRNLSHIIDNNMTVDLNYTFTDPNAKYGTQSYSILRLTNSY